MYEGATSPESFARLKMSHCNLMWPLGLTTDVKVKKKEKENGRHASS